MPTLSLRAFKIGLVVFATILAGISVWTILAELTRSNVRSLPTNIDAADAATAARPDADWAATFGGARGDLRAEHAFTFSRLLWPQANDESSPTTSEQARAAIDNALRQAPHDASVWLLAAGLGARFGWQNPIPIPALKMSYYTGLSEFSLMPLRLLMALRSNALTDGDVRPLVEGDVRTILTRRPDLKDALILAYQSAGPDGRRFLESAVTNTDPSFVATMRVGR
jgi:hypothetical protein